MDTLAGVKVVELPGLAPVPHCSQLLAHFGADVTFVEKKGASKLLIERQLMDKKTIVSLDFEKEKQKLRDLILRADVLLDPFRPGVLEAIGLDPVQLLEENPGLIVARITGYGQTGRFSQVAGHDINYVVCLSIRFEFETALSGVLPILSGPNRPLWPPVNLLADFAAGGLSTAFAICAALIRRNRTGKGAIIDTSMTEGVAYLANYVYSYQEREDFWGPDYGIFSGRFPVYRTYETKDGKFVAVGALEPKFHRQLFKSTDSCVTPVLDIEEVGSFRQHEIGAPFGRRAESGGRIPLPAFTRGRNSRSFVI
ncbi:Alpha-methylacyl-CoA racemase [Aphelenchoides fujianensis]|nr:Alpha-methylacyl-CoA racemase [Aphelenchoides fujianensis]